MTPLHSALPQGVEQDGLQVGRVDRGVRRATGRVGDLLERTQVGVRAERDTDDLDRPLGVGLGAQRVQQLVERDARESSFVPSVTISTLFTAVGSKSERAARTASRVVS